MHTAGITDLEPLARQRMDDAARRADESTRVPPPPRRRSLRRHAAKGLRHLADTLEH
jgi:hypothetical protein